MSGNLIEEIKEAEKKAAAIIEGAEREAGERLRVRREEFAASIRSIKGDFPSKMKKATDAARRDAVAAIGESRAASGNELARLKNEAGSRMEKTKEFIIDRLLGLNHGH